MRFSDTNSIQDFLIPKDQLMQVVSFKLEHNTVFKVNSLVAKIGTGSGLYIWVLLMGFNIAPTIALTLYFDRFTTKILE